MTEVQPETLAGLAPGEAPPADGQFERRGEHTIVSPARKIAYGMGNFGMSISENLVMTFVMTFYPIILKLDPKIVGLALILPRIWDAVADPIFGQISDKTRTRWGRRRPYLLFGAPVFALMTFIMFAPPSFLSEGGLTAYIIVTAFLYYTSYAVVMVPYVAMGAELSTDYHERTRVQVWRSVLMFGANILTAYTWKLSQLDFFPDERVGTMCVVGGFTVLIVLPLWWCFAGTREDAEAQSSPTLPLLKSLRETFSNRGFLMLALGYTVLIVGLWGGFGLGTFVTLYYTYSGGHEGPANLQALSGYFFTPAAVGGTIFWGWLATHIGKKEALLASLAVTVVVAPLSWFAYTPAMPYLQLVFGAVTGICFGAMGTLPNAMVADLCDVDELRTNARREGAYIGVMAFVTKLGFSLTLSMTGILLWVAGINEKIEVQTSESIYKLRLLFAIVPMIAMFITATLIWFYPLNEKRVREVRALLDQRRTEQEASAV